MTEISFTLNERDLERITTIIMEDLTENEEKLVKSILNKFIDKGIENFESLKKIINDVMESKA